MAHSLASKQVGKLSISLWKIAWIRSKPQFVNQFMEDSLDSKQVAICESVYGLIGDTFNSKQVGVGDISIFYDCKMNSRISIIARHKISIHIAERSKLTNHISFVHSIVYIQSATFQVEFLLQHLSNICDWLNSY
jgi:hypothetical protein